MKRLIEICVPILLGLFLTACGRLPAIAPQSEEAAPASAQEQRDMQPTGTELGTPGSADFSGGTGPTVLALSSQEFDFGDVVMSRGIVSRTIEIANTGTDPLHIDSVEPT